MRILPLETQRIGGGKAVQHHIVSHNFTVNYCSKNNKILNHKTILKVLTENTMAYLLMSPYILNQFKICYVPANQKYLLKKKLGDIYLNINYTF